MSITCCLVSSLAADGGIESTNRSPHIQSVRRSIDLATTSLSQANALSSTTSSEPAPVAPPRRKRSSVVVPPVFVSVAEESTSSQSATPNAASKQVLLEDRSNISRSISSDSEFSGREWPVKNYGMETTDGETMEDSDETSTTEDDLDERRLSLPLSEDLGDEDHSSTVSPTINRRKGILSYIHEHHRKSEFQNTKGLAVMDESSSTRRHDRTSVDRPALNAGLMSFSSTEESTPGDRGVAAERKRLFFGSSFSSTAGSSEADLSTFAESHDSGTALTESPHVTRKWKQMETGGLSNSSAATIPIRPIDYHNREDPTVSCNINDRKHMASDHRRGSQISAKWEHELPVNYVKARASAGELSTPAISDSHDSGILSVTNDCRSDRTSQETDNSDQLYSPKSIQTQDTSGQSILLSRRHSFGSRNPRGGAELCVTQTRQTRERRGMTHKGSDVFPGILSKTLGSRATKMYGSNGWKCKSGTKSENEAGGRVYYHGEKLTSDERIIVSDIEFSESAGKTHNVPSCGHHTAEGLPGASLILPVSQDGMQLENSVGEFNTARTTEMRVNKEDDDKSSKAGRLLLEPPKYEEAVKQLKSQQQQQQASLVVSLTNQKEPKLYGEPQTEDDRAVTVKEQEKKKQLAENCITCREQKLESVGIEGLDASTHSQPTSSSCVDLSKGAELSVTDGKNKFIRSKHVSQLKHVRSLGALPAGRDSLRKRFCIPRSKRWSIRDSSNTSSSSSDSDEDATAQRRLEGNIVKKRTRRKRYRRSRRARNSDTRIQTNCENRVNLARSKSDSNTLIRELIIRNEDVEHSRERFRREISRGRADQRTISKSLFQDRQEEKENLSSGTIRVKNLDEVDRSELPSTIGDGNRKSVALKDRDWHKDLVREVESTTQKQQASSHCQNSGTPVSGSGGKWRRKSRESCSYSADKFRNSNNTGTVISTIQPPSNYISNTRQGKLLDYSSSESTKLSTDDATHISEQVLGKSPGARRTRCHGKLNDDESVSCSSGGDGSGGDGGSGSSATNFIELRSNRFKKFDIDLQKDASRSKAIVATGSLLRAQKSHPTKDTLCSDIAHDNKRDYFKEKAETQPPREFPAQPVIKGSEEEEEQAGLSEKTSSDPCKSSTSQFVRISVKDIVAMKNSLSGPASRKNDPTKPPIPSSSGRGVERTESWRPETGRSVVRRASHVTQQVRPEVGISLTPELSRKVPPKTEQKPKVHLAASLVRKNPSETTNQLLLPLRTRSHSVKSLNVRETDVEQNKNAETTAQRANETTEVDTSTCEPFQKQGHTSAVSKSSWQATTISSSFSDKSSTSRSDVFGKNPGKVILKSDAEVCATDKGEKKMGCVEPAAGQRVPRSQESDSATDKLSKTDMPWSVANLRNKYGNQNPQ